MIVCPVTGKTAVSLLQEHMVRHAGSIPNYELISPSTHPSQVWFKYKLRLRTITVEGEGASKKLAKHLCAKAMLIRLGAWPSNGTRVVNGDEDQDLVVNGDQGQDLAAPNTSGTFNAVGALNELCAKHRLPKVQFDEMDAEGPPHRRVFTMKCKVGDKFDIGSGNNKQDAKHSSAKLLLERLKGLHIDSNTPLIKVEEEVKKYTPEELKEIVDKFKSTSFLMKSKSSTTSETDLQLKDYHNITKLDPTFSSAAIDALVEIMRRKNYAVFNAHLQMNSDVLLPQILQELNLESKFILIPSRKVSSTVLTLIIDYKIPLSFLGLGKSYTEAKMMASIDAINWFVNSHI